MCQRQVVGEAEAEGEGEDAVKKDPEKTMKAQNPRMIMILKTKTKKLRRNCPIKRKMVWKGHPRRKTQGQVSVLRPQPKGVQRKPQRREGHPSWSGHLLLQRKVFFVCMLDEFNGITPTCVEILSDQGWPSQSFGGTRGGRKQGGVWVWSRARSIVTQLKTKDARIFCFLETHWVFGCHLVPGPWPHHGR